jgi:ABC-type amino acid transport system permease subunit
VLILWYVVFPSAPANVAVLAAALAFGLNSGAYVSETIRAGIQSIPKGQVEAGRSLGLSQAQTMRLIVLPQAFKNILPALFNEFISLVKETSVAGWIAVTDITRAGDLVRTRVWTYTPLLVSAGIYLTIVLGLTRVQKYIEKRLSISDNQ